MVVKYSGIRLLSNKVSLIIAALSVPLLYFRNTNNHRRKSYLKVMTASALLLVIAAALFARFSSRQEDSPAMKAVAALRNQFGGHATTSAAAKPA